jgi:hypothetical protein
MQPPRILGILVFVAGVVLLIFGVAEMDSFRSQVSNFFTGSPTDRAVWLTIGGVVCIFAGGTSAMLLGRSVVR